MRVKEGHFPRQITDDGLPVLRIFFLLPGKGKVTFIKLVLLFPLQIWILQVHENGSAREEPGLWRKDRAAR